MLVSIYDELVAPEMLAEQLRDGGLIVLNLPRPSALQLARETTVLFGEDEFPVHRVGNFEMEFGWVSYMVNLEYFSLFKHEGICEFVEKALKRQRSQNNIQSVFVTSVF
ncbi:hypothetical protein HZU77_016405 [Neisseriaceae bacterium TC5R-5]|nr:hypothetical protein [Neisseriaceae bacterium TC5R-5]